MKNFIYIMLFLGIVLPGTAQKRIEKTIPIQAGQRVEMNFNHPKLITINTWDKNEIGIVANVSINQGAADDAFDIEYTAGETLRINSHIENFDQIPSKIIIKYQDTEYFFNTSDWNDPKIQKFKKEKGEGNFEYMHHGVMVDIKLEINVPKGIELEVDAKHGLVEVVGITKDMEIESKFGGIDVSVLPEVSATMNVRTKFGEVYSNLDTEFTSDDNYRIGRWVSMETKLNSARYSHYFKSEFGNVYLRKR